MKLVTGGGAASREGFTAGFTKIFLTLQPHFIKDETILHLYSFLYYLFQRPFRTITIELIFTKTLQLKWAGIIFLIE